MIHVGNHNQIAALTQQVEKLNKKVRDLEGLENRLRKEQSSYNSITVGRQQQLMLSAQSHQNGSNVLGFHTTIGEFLRELSDRIQHIEEVVAIMAEKQQIPLDVPAGHEDVYEEEPRQLLTS